MAIGSKVGGNFKSASGLFAKVDGGWKKAQFGYVKVNGQWKQFWAADLTDSFSRADTTSTLGVTESGQAWSILRSQWRINNGFANTTGTKTDYPLALVDLGISNFTLEANELSPGMGVVFRGFNLNNWTAVIPYYNQTSYQYSYCVSGHNESYCISACSEPAGYNLECQSPNSLVVTTYDETLCVDGYYEPDQTICISESCQDIVSEICTADRTVEYSCCIRYCVSRGTSICCDRDICTRTIPGDCYSYTTQQCSCTEFQEVPGDFVCTDYQTFTQTETACEPDGFANVPYYACCQSGTQFVCDVSATATAYNEYFYIRVIQMTNGVVSVLSDTQVNERWNAVKISGLDNTVSITAYKDAAYTQQVGNVVTLTNSVAEGNYGIVGAPSNFEDGRNIGSIKVKAYGQ